MITGSTSVKGAHRFIGQPTSIGRRKVDAYTARPSGKEEDEVV